MRKGFLINEEMRKYFPIYEEAFSHKVYDFATAPFWISYEENFISFFISVEKKQQLFLHPNLSLRLSRLLQKPKKL